jgi:flagellar protein FliO/FliZ
MPVHAENLDQSVKDMYEQPESSKAENAVKDDSTTEEKAASSSGVGLSFSDFFRMIFAMLFVVALLYIVLRFISKKSKTYQQANFIENLGGTNLGNNRSVQIVKVGERVLLVGVGENIQLLTEIEDEEERRQLLEAYNQKYEQMMQPTDFVMKLKKKWTKSAVSRESFSSELKNQLDEMKQSRKQLMDKLDQKGRDDK